MRSAVTALGVCAAEPREDDETDERRRQSQLLADFGRGWAGRNWRRRKMLRAYQAVVMLQTPLAEVAEDHGKCSRTIKRWMSTVEAGVRRHYGRPIGNTVETTLGFGDDRDAA